MRTAKETLPSPELAHSCHQEATKIKLKYHVRFFFPHVLTTCISAFQLLICRQKLKLLAKEVEKTTEETC